MSWLVTFAADSFWGASLTYPEPSLGLLVTIVCRCVIGQNCSTKQNPDLWLGTKTSRNSVISINLQPLFRDWPDSGLKEL